MSSFSHKSTAPTPEAIALSAVEELEQGRELLLELAELLAQGGPVDNSALQLASAARTRLAVAQLRIDGALAMAGAPTRWKP